MNQNPVALDLNDLLITKDFDIELLDSSGKPVSDPGTAEIFSFDWKTDNKNYGTVVVLLGPNNTLQVFFGDNLGRTMEGDDKSDWYKFLEQLKNFASRNLLSFELNNLNRLKYTMQGMAAIKEGLFEGYYGSKKVSYSNQPQKTRLVIKHNKTLGEGDARFRYIESLFVENEQGERFKLPFTKLIGGRAMARHVAEGGNPYDAFGQHICEIVEEMNTLARFVRASKHKNFDGNAGKLVERAISHYQDLKDKAKRLISRRGYHLERKKFDPAEIRETSLTAEAIRDMFIEQSLDQRIEEALPILAKLASKERKMKEADNFECWANNVMEGTWALPDSDQALGQLKQLLSKPLVVGPDGTNATEQLYDLIGDDHLFDIISDLANSDPNANLWDNPDAMKRIEELVPGITADIATEQPPANENLDTDGVMMTKPSNMSSESADPLLRLKSLIK